MPAPTEPRKSIVSVWDKAVNTGELLGTAAFVTPRWVLTAGHVVKKEKYPGGVFLGSVNGPIQVPVKQECIHCHPDLDIALMDLVHEYSDQDFVAVYWGDEDLSGKKVDFYAFNQGGRTKAQHKSHTFDSWHPELHLYIVDHQVLKGFSGGIAVVNGKAVGVIIQRHESDQQTRVVPAHRFHDWFREVLPAETFDKYFRSSWSLPPIATRQVQTEFSAVVRKRISEVLGNSLLRPLKASLLDRLPDDRTTTDPVDLLVPPDASFDIEASIDVLHEATAICLEKADHDNSGVLPKLIEGATNILGWLILLAVSEDWAGDGAVPLDQLQNVQHLRLPVETEAGIEVVSARLRGRKADMVLAEDGVDVHGTCGVSPRELELGIHSEDTLKELMKLIWKAVMKEDRLAPFDASAEKQLALTLKKRKRGPNPRNYYITLPAGKNYDNNLLMELRSRLPDLDSFLIGVAGDQQVLVIKEPYLVVLIREFLLMCREYR